MKCPYCGSTEGYYMKEIVHRFLYFTFDGEPNGANGQRIWENDVISINTYDYNEPAEDFFGKVVYVDAWGCWCIKQPGEEKPIPLCECEGSYLTERVVEGNIFDNPEKGAGE